MPRRSPITTFAGALDAWPNLGVISVELVVPIGTVRAWRSRNSIPLRWWDRLCESASVHQVPVTIRLLHRIAQAANDTKAERADNLFSAAGRMQADKPQIRRSK